MKYVVVLGIFCSTLGAVACGERSADAEQSSTNESREAAQSDSRPTETAEAPPKPTIRVPPGLPPKNLVVKELKKGSGPGARHGQRLTVRHVGVNYKTGEEFEVFWGPGSTFSFNFGSGEVRKGWETGLKGMKVGGRRELILPSRLAYGTGALIYIVELVEIEK